MDLREAGPNIWIVDGPPVRAFGPATLPTRMVVVRLSDGSLWINSPIEANVDEMLGVASLGAVAHLVAPTPLHAWRLVEWKKTFPEACVWEPRSLGDASPPAWAPDIDQVRFEGNLFVTEVEFFHRESRTLMFTDFIQIYPKRNRPLLDLATAIFGVQGGGVPLDIRLSFVNKARARDSLRNILAWDFERLIVAHGECITSGAKEFVRAAFRWLT